jgi:hypothetical protein
MKKSPRLDHLLRENEHLKKSLLKPRQLLTFKKSVRLAWNAHPPTQEQRGELMNTITQLNHEQGAPVDTLCDALTIPRATYYWHLNGKEGECIEQKKISKNAFTADLGETLSSTSASLQKKSCAI